MIMPQLFTPAHSAFQENLDRLETKNDPQQFNLYVGLVALVSGLESEIPRLHARLDQIQSKVDEILRRMDGKAR
jgi:hypothetical protein